MCIATRDVNKLDQSQQNCGACDEFVLIGWRFGEQATLLMNTARVPPSLDKQAQTAAASSRGLPLLCEMRPPEVKRYFSQGAMERA